MRPSLPIIFLLAFHPLLSGVQGIRTLKSSTKHEIIQENAVAMTKNGGGEEVTPCGEGHCSSGKNRKLTISITAFTTKTNSKNLDNGANEDGHEQENVSVSSSLAPDIGRKVMPSPEKYEDMMDMTEMDYSAAKRKPPIHN
ncbi:hypothetical protein Ancab_035113 [Ancistrocladus abbreviatus]